MKRFAAFVLALFLGSSVGGRADDFGPPRDVQSVRYDAVRLIAGTLRYYKLDPARVEMSDTVVSGDWALTSWKLGTKHGIMVVMKRRSQWWDVLEAYTDVGGGWWFDAAPPLKGLDTTIYDGPSTSLLTRMSVQQNLVSAAAAHNPDVRVATGTYVGHGDPYCWDFCTLLKPGNGLIESANRNAGAGYRLKIALSSNNSTSADSVKRVLVRMPTDGESTQALHGDAFVFFTVELAGPAPVTFKPGTTVDVWFPHVLDAYRHYGLTAAMANSAFGPVRATLADNTLHFVLPAFTVTPGDPVMFEIDGDP